MLLCCLALMTSMLGAAETGKRNYAKPVTAEEKEDIRYIVTSLAQFSLVKLGLQKSSLTKAGDRIDHVHPLRFLMCVFTDEELKAGVQAIRDRKGKVWKDFSGGLFKSLTKESSEDNMKDAYILDFAYTLGIDPSQIKPIIEQQDWKKLIKELIALLPRTNDPGYDL